MKPTDHLERARREALAKAQDSYAPVFEDMPLARSLRPFQKAGVAYAMEARRAFIADEMGTGKSIQALATLAASNAYPALIVCPATLKAHWQQEIHKWIPERTVAVLHGRKPGGLPTNRDLYIVNYDILEARFDDLARLEFKAIVFDESHYLKNYRAKRSKAALKLARLGGAKDIVLCLTGTPILNRPLDLVHQLDILDRLDDFGGRWAFLQRYCDAQEMPWGWDVSGASNLAELNAKLTQICFIRRTKDEVLTDLPEKQRTHLPIEIDNRKDYERTQHNLLNWLEAKLQTDATFWASLRGLDTNAQGALIDEKLETGLQKALKAETIVKMNALRQLAALGKLRAIKKWLTDFLQTDEKLVVFSGFRDVQRRLYSHLMAHDIDACKLFADDSMAARHTAIQRFQQHPSTRVIVCSLKAAGHGIDLSAASNVCFVDIGWSAAEMAQAEDRCHRHGQANSVNVWYLLAENTIEMDILDLLKAKQQLIDAALDAVPVTSQSVLDDVIAGLLLQLRDSK